MMIEVKAEKTHVDLTIRGEAEKCFAECLLIIESISRSIAESEEVPTSFIKFMIIEALKNNKLSEPNRVSIKNDVITEALKKIREGK